MKSAKILTLLLICTSPCWTLLPAYANSPSELPPGKAPTTSVTDTLESCAEEKKAPLPILEIEDIQKELLSSICSLRQPAVMDISGIVIGKTPEIEIRNLYYELLNQNPDLKYAYDLSAQIHDGLLTCQIFYMPYKTGNYPEDWKGITIDSLPQLLEEAEKHLGSNSLPIRFTVSDLAPDTIQNTLQQIGGGYILCSLSHDGTELTYTPALGTTMEECLSWLDQANHLADQVIQEVITPSMTKQECAKTLYDYLIHTVRYDRRYYTDRENMPYKSQTALGALQDKLAICGGYSHALKLLFEKAGIPCYTVNGTYDSELHMWNLAFLDGQWLWFDATADRGLPENTIPRHFAQEQLNDRQHLNNEELLSLLSQFTPQS